MISQSWSQWVRQFARSTSIVDNDRLQLYRGHSQFPTDVLYLQQVVWLNYEECVLGSYYQYKIAIALYNVCLPSLRVWWHGDFSNNFKIVSRMLSKAYKHPFHRPRPIINALGWLKLFHVYSLKSESHAQARHWYLTIHIYSLQFQYDNFF
jgi:hypothetical protein